MDACYHMKDGSTKEKDVNGWMDGCITTTIDRDIIATAWVYDILLHWTYT